MARLVPLAVAVLATPCVARADAGVPMLALVWPASWYLFLPVVAVEAWIGRKITGLPLKRAALASAVSNAASTLVGLPLAWGLFLAVELIVSGGGRALGIDTFWRRVFAVTVQAPWLIPYESELHWMIPVAAMVLLVPFFFASVLIERTVFRRFDGVTPELARRWSWVANLATYGFMFAALVGLLIAAVIHGPPGR
jgi:hypothetical protein